MQDMGRPSAEIIRIPVAPGSELRAASHRLESSLASEAEAMGILRAGMADMALSLQALGAAAQLLADGMSSIERRMEDLRALHAALDRSASLATRDSSHV